MKYPRITWRFQILGETYASADQHWFSKRSGLKLAKRVRFSRSKLLCRRFPRPVALEDAGWESSKNHWLGRFGWFICGNSWEALGFWILFNLCFLCRHGKIDLDLGRISFQGAFHAGDPFTGLFLQWDAICWGLPFLDWKHVPLVLPSLKATKNVWAQPPGCHFQRWPGGRVGWEPRWIEGLVTNCYCQKNILTAKTTQKKYNNKGMLYCVGFP